MERDAMVMFRAPAKVKKALQAAAREDSRTMSNLTLRIVTEWLRAKGHLRSPKPARRG